MSHNIITTNFFCLFKIELFFFIYFNLSIKLYFNIIFIFARTELSHIAKDLNNELLLMAARAYLLWNFPGVAMHPSAYCNLSVVNKSRWK